MDVPELLAREAIRDTIARYGFAADRGHFAEVADCFCDEGVLEVRGSWRVAGRRAIEDKLAGLSEGSRTNGAPIGLNSTLRQRLARGPTSW